jgi:hypothetical protein
MYVDLKYSFSAKGSGPFSRVCTGRGDDIKKWLQESVALKKKQKARLIF